MDNKTSNCENPELKPTEGDCSKELKEHCHGSQSSCKHDGLKVAHSGGCCSKGNKEKKGNCNCSHD